MADTPREHFIVFAGTLAVIIVLFFIQRLTEALRLRSDAEDVLVRASGHWMTLGEVREAIVKQRVERLVERSGMHRKDARAKVLDSLPFGKDDTALVYELTNLALAKRVIEAAFEEGEHGSVKKWRVAKPSQRMHADGNGPWGPHAKAA